MQWLRLPGEEGVVQPDKAQLLRAAIPVLHPHVVAGDQMVRGSRQRRPRQGSLLDGDSTPLMHDTVHDQQVREMDLAMTHNRDVAESQAAPESFRSIVFVPQHRFKQCERFELSTGS